ncbi:uncharacterized protein LOC129796589 isoform X2 [Lutzomyia longipalpis]|uniref:uncharacterized protein LOC129796589 isoform X2 n=1 Tax=Lutzomyia longipalpis TaxID=7200 RepID=UPI0024841B6E|nr:uncharacterized protein LOC129796589 isoform X2 [Lutzomyia longipalpis]
MRSELESFTLKQRVFLVKNYYQYTGDYLCVKTKYEDNYKDSNEYPPFSYDILIEIINLFERTGSVLKATEGAYGGTGQVIEQIYVRDFVKEEDPVVLPQEVPIPSTSTARVGEGDVTDDQEESMMWDQAEFPSGSSSDQDENIAEKHVCDQCNVSFKNLEDWNGHQMKKHNIIPDISKSSKTEHKKLETAFHKKNDPLKTKRKKHKVLPYNLERFSKKMSAGKGHDTDIESLRVDSSTRLAGIVTLDPSYDRIFNSISWKLDRLLSMQKDDFDKSFTHFLEESAGNSSELKLKFPIKTKEDLHEFNSNLRDEQYKMAAIKELSKINGYTGTSDGTKCAYKLVDYVLSRDLLTHYSWTGASRSGTKEAFNQFSHFVDLFYSVIRMADSTYAKVDAENFFSQRILKYSTMRLQRSKEITSDDIAESSAYDSNIL